MAAAVRTNCDTLVNADQELQELIDERVRAVQTKDVTAIRARPADDVITFDVLPPLNSRCSDGAIDHMQKWFDGYDGPIDFSVHDVNIAAEENIGFCSFLYHVGGTLKTGGQVDMWVRAALCCRRIDRRWRIVHDHESVPFDPSTWTFTASGRAKPTPLHRCVEQDHQVRRFHHHERTPGPTRFSSRATQQMLSRTCAERRGLIWRSWAVRSWCNRLCEGT